MSGRQTKREKIESRNRSRLRYLIAVLSLEDLKRVGIIAPDADFVEKPNSTTVERMIDERIKTFQKADAKLRRRSPPIKARFPDAPPMIGTRCTGAIVDELHEFGCDVHAGPFR